ncbi:MAG TPA: DNA polymerase III subunit delta' [Aggregatilineaceae bacterium]|nr:DNA polymerase III subunit delta' [Aggregatilineaceae bacterium]
MVVKRNWPVIGHEWAVEQLARAIQHGRTRHAYLFTGPDRIGKTTLARALAATINCTAESAPCGECRNCKLFIKGAHPDLTVLEGENGTIKIDQVRAIQQTVALRPYEARYRVAILRRFHEATPQAQDALLKTLEEPPPNVVLIVTANAADALLPTILSRCQPLHLRPLPIQQLQEALKQGWNVAEDEAQLLAQISGGRIGWAIKALEDPAEREWRTQVLDALEMALKGNRRERFALVEHLALEKSVLLPMLDVWQGYWRDALLMASGSRAPITNYDRRGTIRDMAIGREAAQQALEATRRTIDQVDRNANARLALEVLMLDYPQPKAP